MEEIAYDITAHYPLPPKNVEWGEVSIIQYLDIKMSIFGVGIWKKAKKNGKVFMKAGILAEMCD